MTRKMADVKIPAIAPSILTADFLSLKRQIQDAENAGVDLIHLDVMDGRFAPNISFGPLLVSAVREATGLPLDVHLMISNPERFIDEFIDAGADNITIHAEATLHLHRLIQQIKSQDVGVGVAINPATPLSAVEEALSIIDLVLIMSVNPGFGGQTFIPESVGKVRRLNAMLKDQRQDRIRIEVDGGINKKTIKSTSDAGAQIFVAGSSVYNEVESVHEAVAGLRSALTS